MRLKENLRKNDDIMGYNPFNDSYEYEITFEDEGDFNEGVENTKNNLINNILDVTWKDTTEGPYTLLDQFPEEILQQMVDYLSTDSSLEEAVPHIITRKEAVAKLLEFGDLEAIVRAMNGDQAIDIARSLKLVESLSERRHSIKRSGIRPKNE